MESTDRFDVIVLGFELRAESPEARLQRAFGIDASLAEQLVSGVPSTVQRAVSRVRAEYFRRALSLLGARVEVREPDGQLVRAPEPEANAGPAQSGREPWRASEPPPARTDPTGRTLATAAPIMTMSGRAPAPNVSPGFVRAPAEPTLREVPAPVLQADLRVAASAVSDRSTRLSPSADDPLAARIPSSIWDPPPSRQQAPARAGAQTSNDGAADVARRSAAPGRAAAQFDLTKSVALSPLWRPPPTSGPPGLAPLSAITLDEDLRNAGPARVLSPWEQPNAKSMAEPKLVSNPPKPSAPLSARAAQGRANRVAAAAPLAASERKPAPGPSASRTKQPRPKLDLRSFWESLGDALLLPFSGPGPYWISAITACSMLVGPLDRLNGLGFGSGWALMFIAHTALLAFACDYYSQCFWAAAGGKDVLDRAPRLAEIFPRYLRSGVHLSLFVLASQAPMIGWLLDSDTIHPTLLDTLSDPVTWLLALLPVCYWPMAVGVAALKNDFAAIWNLPVGLRVIARAPREYAAIAAVGLVALFGSWAGLVVLSWFYDVTGAVLSSAIGLPLAISHGVQGALMGHLVRARAEIFE